MPDNVDVLLIFLFQRSGTGQCFQMSLLLFISDADILVKAFWKYKSWKLWPEKKKNPDYIGEEKWVFERYILHSFKNGKQLSLMSNQD